MLGPWSAYGRGGGEPVTILAGLRGAFPAATIACARGCTIQEIDGDGKASALALASRSDLTILCLGEGEAMSGEAASRARPTLPDAQRELARGVIDLGKPVVVLLFAGRP